MIAAGRCKLYRAGGDIAVDEGQLSLAVAESSRSARVARGDRPIGHPRRRSRFTDAGFVAPKDAAALPDVPHPRPPTRMRLRRLIPLAFLVLAASLVPAATAAADVLGGVAPPESNGNETTPAATAARDPALGERDSAGAAADGVAAPPAVPPSAPATTAPAAAPTPSAVTPSSDVREALATEPEPQLSALAPGSGAPPPAASSVDAPPAPPPAGTRPAAAPATGTEPDGDTGTVASDDAPGFAGLTEAANESLVLQVIRQIQRGCQSYCYGTAQVQRAIQLAETIQTATAVAGASPSERPGTAPTSSAVARNVSRTIQFVWQTQLGCVAFCVDTSQYQEALQSANTVQSALAIGLLEALALNDSSTVQLAFQEQFGCSLSCVDVLQVQSLLQRQALSQSAVAVGGAIGGPRPDTADLNANGLALLDSLLGWAHNVGATVELIWQEQLAVCSEHCIGDSQAQAAIQQATANQTAVAGAPLEGGVDGDEGSPPPSTPPSGTGPSETTGSGGPPSPDSGSPFAADHGSRHTSPAGAPRSPAKRRPRPSPHGTRRPSARSDSPSEPTTATAPLATARRDAGERRAASRDRRNPRPWHSAPARQVEAGIAQLRQAIDSIAATRMDGGWGGPRSSGLKGGRGGAGARAAAPAQARLGVVPHPAAAGGGWLALIAGLAVAAGAATLARRRMT